MRGKVKGLLIVFLILIVLPLASAELGYELLDNNKVLHLWNTEDDYYFNATSGMQFTNHYDEYWSKNVFCLGWYDGNTWNKITCVDELNFDWSIDTDNETYINVTGWKDITYMGKDVRTALRYHLKPYDTRLSVIPYMKNIGDSNINVELGFAWHIRNIAVDNQEENNTISVYSSEGYPVVSLHGLDYQVTKTNGSFFLTNNDTLEHIYLEWNQEIPHILNATSQAGQYNSPITLGLKVGTLDIGQEKTTTLGWVDATPYCENVGTDQNEKVCFYDSLTAADDSNYSDATLANNRFPYFRITISNLQPFGCNYECDLYRRSTDGGSWLQMYSGLGTLGCYNVAPSVAGKCNSGYCSMEHTPVIEDRTDWDLCISYSGARCSEDGNIYCSEFGSQGASASSYGDSRANLSYNEHTPLDTNTTVINWTNATGTYLNASFDTWMGDDFDRRIKSIINWFKDGTYYANQNITYTCEAVGQEDANTTASSGTWSFLAFANVIDGSWAAPPGTAFNPNVAYGYMNYTKIESCSALWEVKDNCDQVNLTVPTDCWDAFDDEIAFRIISDAPTTTAYWQCWDGSDWETLRDSCISSPVFYEEKIWWRTETQDNFPSLNVTCDGNFTFEVETWDDSYFSPTNNQTWVASNNSWFEACVVAMEEVRENWWMLSIVFSLISVIFILFIICQKLDNKMMKIPCYVSQIILLIITIHFSFTALGAFENTTLVNDIMQTLYAVALKGIVLPMFILLMIYIIYDSVKIMREGNLNKF